MSRERKICLGGRGGDLGVESGEWRVKNDDRVGERMSGGGEVS